MSSHLPANGCGRTWRTPNLCMQVLWIAKDGILFLSRTPPLQIPGTRSIGVLNSGRSGLSLCWNMVIFWSRLRKRGTVVLSRIIIFTGTAIVRSQGQLRCIFLDWMRQHTCRGKYVVKWCWGKVYRKMIVQLSGNNLAHTQRGTQILLLISTSFPSLFNSQFGMEIIGISSFSVCFLPTKWVGPSTSMPGFYLFTSTSAPRRYPLVVRNFTSGSWPIDGSSEITSSCNFDGVCGLIRFVHGTSTGWRQTNARL